jgi:hypothetical protein
MSTSPDAKSGSDALFNDTWVEALIEIGHPDVSPGSATPADPGRY